MRPVVLTFIPFVSLVTLSAASLSLVACGGGSEDAFDPSPSKGTPAEGYSQVPVEGTLTDPGTTPPATPQTGDLPDGGPVPLADGGAVLPDGGSADGSLPPFTCKTLGRCCAKVTACDGETLACMRTVMADEPVACDALMKQYDKIGCDHPSYVEGPKYSSFPGCPQPDWSGGGGA